MKPFGSILLLTCAGSALRAAPGAPATASGSGTAATILPASGRNNQGGSVGATEQPVPGTTTSVNTLNPSVQISGPYSGSARSTTAMPFSGKLSLAGSAAARLAYNLGAVGITQTVRQNSAQVKVARSALLPNINGTLSETVEQTDLAALRPALQRARLPHSHRRGPVQLLRPASQPQPDRGEPDHGR